MGKGGGEKGKRYNFVDERRKWKGKLYGFSDYFISVKLHV